MIQMAKPVLMKLFQYGVTEKTISDSNEVWCVITWMIACIVVCELGRVYYGLS